MKIVLCGPPGVGKTTIAKLLSKQLQLDFFDTDTLLESLYLQKFGSSLPYFEIYQKEGELKFRKLEEEVLSSLQSSDRGIIALGGGISQATPLIHSLGTVIYLHASIETLWSRFHKRSRFPSYLPKTDSKAAFSKLMTKRAPCYEHIANITIDTDLLSQEEIVERITKVNQ